MSENLSIAFIGGGNMANALASGMTKSLCDASSFHVVDINDEVLKQWEAKGASVSNIMDDTLANKRIWILSVKPQFLHQAIEAAKPFLHTDTLIISVAAGVSSDTISKWLGSDNKPWTKLIRCMPNTPALIGKGATGMFALDGVTESEKYIANQIMNSVGQVVWVSSDDDINAVTALSGSGPAYVFLFMEAMIKSGISLGLSEDQSKQLAMATVSGAAQLAISSTEEIQILRDRVTSKGGTTAAALSEFQSSDFERVINSAMHAAYNRAIELSKG